MSIPLVERRSTRVTAQPPSLADEQFTRQYHAREALDRRRAIRRSLQSDQSSDSEEDVGADDEASSSEEEEEEKENIPPHSRWSDHTHHITLPPFIVHSCSVLPRHRPMTEMGYLQCFLTQEVVSLIATNTNLYAASKHAPAGWATTAEEVWLFIAVHIFMGIVDLPSMDAYWHHRWRQQYVVNAFSRDRFKEMQRYFHIAEPTPAGVRPTVIDKLEPLYTRCRYLFNTSFIPPRDLTVDETMVRFKGRSSWKTVIKGKPMPIGYKLYTLASHGYLLNFAIYRGKGGYAVKQGVLHHTVTELVDHWKSKQHILYFDNLYTSPALCDHLLRIGFRSCGTFRPNRSGLPRHLGDAMKELQEGQMKAWQREDLGCIVWRDKKPVLMLSTHHKVDDMVTFEQDRGPNRPTSVTKPQVVLDYNVGKCGVDTVDQLRQYYAMQRKSYKTWTSLAWWLVDMCIINAYTLWCLDTKAVITQLDFRVALLDQLAAAYPPRPIHAHHAAPPHRSRAGGGHWPKHTAARRDWVHCSGGRRHRVKTYFECELCRVHLCVDPCFKLYHEHQ
jgi:Transposase IS4